MDIKKILSREGSKSDEADCCDKCGKQFHEFLNPQMVLMCYHSVCLDCIKEISEECEETRGETFRQITCPVDKCKQVQGFNYEYLSAKEDIKTLYIEAANHDIELERHDKAPGQH